MKGLDPEDTRQDAVGRRVRTPVFCRVFRSRLCPEPGFVKPQGYAEKDNSAVKTPCNSAVNSAQLCGLTNMVRSTQNHLQHNAPVKKKYIGYTRGIKICLLTQAAGGTSSVIHPRSNKGNTTYISSPVERQSAPSGITSQYKK